MAKSDNLRKAKAAKLDDFFTDINDIIAEIAQHKDYVRQFEGKVVLCNCDDPEWSAFVEFFRKFFHKLKLKKMIATHYNADGSPSYMLEWSGEKINGDTVNMIKKPLKGNGDFRSPECIELLKEADILVTNPPFSLYRQYTNILYKYNKQYIIWGNNNAIAYKEIFPLLRDGKMFIGYMANKTCYFQIPDSYEKWDEKYTEKKGDGHKYAKVPAITVYTNLDLDKSHEPLVLTKNYKGNEEKYPKYDNYDAIECNKVANIPKDYFPCWYDCPHAGECEYAKTEGRGEALCESPCNGEIGVPITDLSLTKDTPIGDADKQASKQTLLSVQQDHHQAQTQEIDVHAEDTSACLSHTCHHTATNNSELLDSCRAAEASSVAMMDGQSSMSEEKVSMPASSFSGRKKCNGVIGVPLTYISAHCQDMFDILWKSGDIEWCLSDECSIFTPPDSEKAAFYKKQNRTWRVQNPYITDEKDIAHTTYNRIFIRRRKEK